MKYTNFFTTGWQPWDQAPSLWPSDANTACQAGYYHCIPFWEWS